MTNANEKAPRPGGALQTAQRNTGRQSNTFPSHDSVKAAVLADLLEGREFTHLDCWLRHGSSRLSHHIHVLIHQHGWDIACNERSVGTSDGRRQSIGFYSLPQHQANPEIARQFVADVRAARAALRNEGR